MSIRWLPRRGAVRTIRAGVGKATIYRRWSSKEALVLEALGADQPGVTDEPWHGIELDEEARTVLVPRGVRLDLEMTGNATVNLTLSSSTTSAPS